MCWKQTENRESELAFFLFDSFTVRAFSIIIGNFPQDGKVVGTIIVLWMLQWRHHQQQVWIQIHNNNSVVL